MNTCVKKFDIIIPVSKNDANFVYKVVYHLTNTIDNINTIYLLASSKLLKQLDIVFKQFPICCYIDEDNLIPNLSFERIRYLLKNRTTNTAVRPGWFFQQFLKLAFSLSEYSNEYYLSWDADSIPLSKITYFENDSILFNPKKEYNDNYFNTMKKMLGYGKVVDYSFISESMMFKKEIVKSLINDIESSSAKGSDWIEKILSCCDFSNPYPAFSEFETYGSYCFVHYPGLYKPRHLNSFREAGMICGRNISDAQLKLLSFDLDMASFEKRHSPYLPKVTCMLWRLHNWFLIYRNLKFKEIIAKKMKK